MTDHADADRPVVVFDALGTLVDQAGSLRREVSAATGWGERATDAVVTAWLDRVANREREVNAGETAFIPSHTLDLEVLERLSVDMGLPASSIASLASAAQRMEPWPDAIEGLARLAADVTVMGLSNASRRVLTGLNSSSGMRWHQVLSAEDAGAHKPDLAIYRLTLAAAPAGAHPPHLVAAHAWDLRAAAEAGLHTAYVPRPTGDPPTGDDAFDLYAEDPTKLHAMLSGHRA